MLGVFLMILELQVAWDGSKLVWSRASRTMRFLITFLTALLIVQLLDYYNGVLALMTKSWKDSHVNLKFNISGWNVLQSSLVAPMFWGEAFICILHAPPIPAINDKVGLFMFLRFYMVFRVIKDHSTIYKFRNTIMRKYSKYGIKHWGPPKFSWAISSKALFYRHPFIFISSLTLWTLWVCGHLIYIFERENDPILFTYHGALYLSMISMITGWPTDTYEVYWPQTRMGRFSCIMSTLVGLFLLSLLLEVLSSFVVPTGHQRPALTWAHRHDIKDQLRDSAARIIQLVWKRRSMAKRKRSVFSGDRKRCCGYQQSLGARYIQAVKDFRSLMRQKIALQISFTEQGKDLADPDEPPPPATVYSDEDYSYAQETGHGEVEERLRAMEMLIQNLTSKLDVYLTKDPNLMAPSPVNGSSAKDHDLL